MQWKRNPIGGNERGEKTWGEVAARQVGGRKICVPFFHWFRVYSTQHHHCHLHNHICHHRLNHHNVPFPFILLPLNVHSCILSSLSLSLLYIISLLVFIISLCSQWSDTLTALWNQLLFLSVTCRMLWRRKFFRDRSRCSYYVCSWCTKTIRSVHDVSYGKQMSYYRYKKDFCTGEQQYTAGQDGGCAELRAYGALSHSVCDHGRLQIQDIV